MTVFEDLVTALTQRRIPYGIGFKYSVERIEFLSTVLIDELSE